MMQMPINAGLGGLLRAHDTSYFPALYIIRTRQRPTTRGFGVVEKDAIFILSTAFDNFRCVVHTDVGRSACVVVMSRH